MMGTAGKDYCILRIRGHEASKTCKTITLKIEFV